MTGETRFFAYASLATAAMLLLAACTSKSEEKPAPAGFDSAPRPALMQPDPAKLAEQAPNQFQVVFETSKGNFTVTAHRDWSPLGVDRFYYLVNNGFFNEARFFRAMRGFMVQFGINGTPAVATVWENLAIKGEPVKMGNTRGRVSFAMSGYPDGRTNIESRTTQMFINLVDNSGLDASGFGAFAEVTDGMAVVDSLYTGYSETPNQGLIQSQGNAYLIQNFPLLDYIKTTKVLPSAGGKSP